MKPLDDDNCAEVLMIALKKQTPDSELRKSKQVTRAGELFAKVLGSLAQQGTSSDADTPAEIGYAPYGEPGL